jgi:ribosomal protein S18 acetylase RimI-like enzyme
MSQGAEESLPPLYDRSVPGEGASVLVRRATVEDAAAVTALHGYLQRMHTETHPDIFKVFDPDATRPHFEDMLASGDALIWVAEIDGEAVGYAWANLVHREATDLAHEQHALHVQALAVAPRARGAGVGRALMQAAEDHARSLRLASVTLNTWVFNTGAHDFYERLGYERLHMTMRRRL